MFIQSNMLQIGKKPNGFVFPNNNYSKYAFYWLPGGVDKVSKQALSGGTIDDGYLSTYGNYTVLNSFSNDISNAYWTKSAAVTITGMDGFQAGAQYDYIGRPILTTEGLLYTISFFARGESGGTLTNYGLRHHDSASGNTTVIELTETLKPYSVTVLGRIGGGLVNFGFKDNNTSDWSKVYIDTINVTETAYAMPPAENNEAGELSVPYTYADSTQGPKFDLSEMPDLIDGLDGIADGDDQRPASPNWSSATGWTDDGYTATTDGSHTQNFLQLPLTGTNDPSKYFEVSYTVSGLTTGSFGLKVSNNGDEDDTASLRTINGTYIMRSHGGTVDNVQVTCVAGTVGSLTVNYIKEISPAEGELVVEWMPMFDYDEGGTTNVSILDVLGTGGAGLMYHNGTYADIKTKDSINVASADTVNFQAGTLYTIKAMWGTTHPTYPGVSKMQLIVTDGTTTWASPVVDFDGSFDPEDFLSFGWENEYWQKFKSSKLLKEATSWV